MGAKAGTAYVDFEGDFSSLHKQIEAQLAPITSKFGKLGKAGAAGIAGVAVGAGLAGKALYDIGASFDDAYDTIRVGTGKTGKQLDRLKKDFKAVVTHVPTDFGTAADAISQLNRRLDESGKPLQRVAENVLELTRMTGTDLSGNIQSLTRLFGDWGIAQNKQVPTLNKLWRASQATGIQIGTLSDYMVQFGSPLRQMGFDFDTAAAMFSKFEKEGVNLQTAMPGLRMALKNFAAEGRDPAKALQETIDKIAQAGSTAKANTMAFDIFGTRAGPDLAAAIREGRFDFDELIHTIDHGHDTIKKSSQATRDFSENWQIFKNRVMVLLEPIATKFFGAINKGMSALTKFNLRDLTRSLGLTRGDMLAIGKVVGTLADIFRRVFGQTIKLAVGGALDVIRGFAKMVRGTVKLVGDLLHGDFSAAWRDVKQIFRGGVQGTVGVFKTIVAPILGAARGLDDALGHVFGKAWDKVEGIFTKGANAVVDIVNALIDVINVIPGVPDIDDVGRIGGGGHRAHPNQSGHGPGSGFARGGAITKPMAIVGEEAPQHPEWVIATNPAYRQNNVRYWMQAGHDLGIPGFLGGGDITGALGDVGGFAKGLPGKALGVGKDILGKGAQFFLDKLPDPSDFLPKWLLGLGGYLIDKVSGYITSGFSEGNLGGGGGAGGFGGLKGSGAALMREISARKHWNFPDWWALDAAETSHGANLVNPNSTARLRGQFLSMNWGKYGPGSDPTPWPSMHDQIISMARYIQERYGNPSAAWAFHQANNWYREGGLVEMLAGGGQVGDDRFKKTGASTPPRSARAGGPGNWAGKPRTLDRVLSVANYVNRLNLPYVFGGGHSNPASLGGGVDCSGAISYLVQQSGWDKGTTVSGGMTGWFKPGKGKDFTILANPEHVYAVIAGKAWGAMHTGTTVGYGWNYDFLPGFAERHPVLGAGDGGGGSGGGGTGPQMGLDQAIGVMGVEPNYPAKFGQFGPLPDTLKGCTAELHARRSQLAKVEAAMKGASQADRKSLGETAKRLRSRIRHLIDQRNRIIQRHRREFGRVVGRRGAMPEQQGVIGAFEDRIASIGERLRIKLGMEPELPPASYVAEESALYTSLLGQQFGLRNYLIGAEWTGRYTADDLSAQIKRMQKNPKQRWRVPALKAARSNILGTLIPEWEGRLGALQGPGGPRLWLMDLPEIGVLGGEIFDTQNEIRQLGFKDTGESVLNSERFALLEERLRLANQRFAVSQAQYPVLNPPGQVFHEGGIVQGPRGAEIPVTAKVGEGIFTEEQMAAMGGDGATLYLIIEKGAGVDESKIRAVARDEAGREIRTNVVRSGRTPAGAGRLGG